MHHVHELARKTAQPNTMDAGGHSGAGALRPVVMRECNAWMRAGCCPRVRDSLYSPDEERADRPPIKRAVSLIQSV